MVELGKIQNIDVKDVWQNETSDFTPWLAENLDLLGEELGLRLELDRTEARVGDFSLDILARDADSNAVVAIENQIAGTDHGHLGQLLTYAAGTEASIVIWVATESSETSIGQRWTGSIRGPETLLTFSESRSVR